jgi:hypothetical protein
MTFQVLTASTLDAGLMFRSFIETRTRHSRAAGAARQRRWRSC